jgi:hypothetical protein
MGWAVHDAKALLLILLILAINVCLCPIQAFIIIINKKYFKRN